MTTKCDECNSKDCPGRTVTQLGILKYPDHGTSTCDAECRDGFLCTRPYNHEGSHEASGGIDSQCAIWD